MPLASSRHQKITRLWDGSGLFSYCTNLERVTIFSDVESIGEYAFSLTKLSEVHVEKGDAGRMRNLFIGSGHSVANLDFLETAVPYLSIPTGVEVTDNRYDCLHVEWDAMSGVTGYRVYRKAQEASDVSGASTTGGSGGDIVLDPGELIADIRQNCYDDYEVRKGQSYVYCVAAYFERKKDVVVSAYASADGELRDIIEVEPEYRAGADIGVLPVLLRDDGCEREVKVSGLPDGLKFASKDVVNRKTKEVIVPANSIYGTPTKSGIYPVTVRISPKDPKSAEKTFSKTVRLYVRKKGECAFDATWDSTQGNVIGIGMSRPGKKVTLKATAGKGYAFAGWYLGGELVTKSASYSFKATGEDADYRARFVTLEDDKASIRATVNGMAFPSTSGQETASPLATNALCGVALFWPLSHEALSATSVKVSGLPKGLKYDTKKKAITGVPTVPGKTSSVKVAVTTAGKQKATFVLKVTVDPLPEWARGQFTGTVDGNALTMTVGSTGKVSGKFKDGITNWTFSASSFATNSVTVGETNLFCRATAKGTYLVKSGKKTVKKAVTAPISFMLVALPDVSPIAAEGLGNFADGTDNVEIRRLAGARISVGEAGGGTVKMDKSYGQVAVGGKVKLTAKANKKQAFAGWYDVVMGELISQALTYSLVSDGATDRFIEARFIPESALTEADVALDWNAPTEIYVGVSYLAQPKASGTAAVKIASVSGLPKGLSWKSGKVSGVPTVAKTHTVTVKVALTTNSKKVWTFKVPIEVRALPKWAAQTFEGDLGTEDEPVPVTVTIGSSGKVSGKYTLDGAKWTFSSSSLSSAVCDEATGEPSVFTANVTASATISKKKKSQKLVVTVTEEGVDIQAP